MTLTDLPHKKHCVGGMAPRKPIWALTRWFGKTNRVVRLDGHFTSAEIEQLSSLS